MLKDIQESFASAGLTLNVSKCKIQTNAHTRRTPDQIEVGGMSYPVVPPTDGSKFLGTQYTLCGGVGAELDARIASAWGKFHQILPLLKRRNQHRAHKAIEIV